MSGLSSAFSATRYRAGALATGCATTAALALVASCGTTNQNAGLGHATARQAVAMAARSAAKLTSLTMVETMTMHGIPLPGVGGLTPGASADGGLGSRLTIRANASMRLKPALLADIAAHMNIGGRSVTLDEILTSRAIYLKMPGVLPVPGGKPWAKVSLASLPNGMSLRKLFQQTQNGNPLTAMGSPSALSKFLRAAKHLKVVHDQNVGGVATTEYSGTLNLRSLIAQLPDAERKLLGSTRLRTIPFRVWIDHQHFMRKMVMRLAFGKALISLTANITSINKPVRIVPPPSSQVSAISHP